MAFLDHRMEVEKFDGSNYRDWKFAMSVMLKGRGLWKYVNGTATYPVDDVKKCELHDRESDLAYSLIIQTIDKGQYIHVRHTESAKDAWDALGEQYNKVSLYQQTVMRQKYHSVRYQSGSNMLEHINCMKTLRDQLNEMGDTITDKQLACDLLASLPLDKYEALITSLDVQGEENLQFDRLKYLLLQFSDREAFNDSTRKDSEANFAKSSDCYRRVPGKRRNGLCYNCGSPHHFKRDCPQSKDKACSRGGRNSSQSKQNYHQQSGHRNSNWHRQRHSTGHTARMTSVTSSTAFIAKKYCKNFECKSSDDNVWIIDSGASDHMTSKKSDLSSYERFDCPHKVILGDNSETYAEGKGKLHCYFGLGDDKDKVSNYAVTLHNVLFVPKLGQSLLSVRKIDEHGGHVVFYKGRVSIRHKRRLHGLGYSCNSLFHIHVIPRHDLNTVLDRDSKKIWHERFGHIGMKRLESMLSGDKVSGISSFPNKFLCEGCIKGKLHKTPFRNSEFVASDLLELVHSDVCDMTEHSVGGNRYYITFTDDKSRFVHTMFMKHKSEAFHKFKEYVNLVENVTGKRIKILRSDNGGEYDSHKFVDFCKSRGIYIQRSIPRTPEQNGVAERLNRTLCESARTMLKSANLPNSLWGEAIATATHIHNRSQTSAAGNITPYEHWYGRKPNVSYFRVFGCLAYVHIPKELRRKLEGKASKVVFVGYPSGTKGWKFFDPISKRMFVSRDAVFLEDQFMETGDRHEDGHGRTSCVGCDCVAQEENSSEEFFESAEIAPDTEPNVEVAPVAEIIPTDVDNGNLPVQPTYEETFMQSLPMPGTKRQVKPVGKIAYCLRAASLLADINEPITIEEAWSGKDGDKWKKATDSEFQSLKDMKTWDLVESPANVNIVGCKWVFKIKRNSDNSINRFKARLVAQGFSQEEGIDFEEVFSPVVRYSTIRVLLSLAAILDLELHQMDVTTAFLNGDLDKDIYMKQPKGYIDLHHPNFVCKLRKSIYGLKQAARLWNIAFDSFLKQLKFKQIYADACVYIHSYEHSGYVIIALYVDDLLILSNDVDLISKTKIMLNSKFCMIDQGEAHCILGMTIKRDRQKRCLWVSQPKYLEGILHRFGMEDCNPVSTPLDVSQKFRRLKADEDAFNKEIYQAVIGCLTYAMTATRPDLASAVGILSRFMSNPGIEHWQGVKRILRYLKGTIDYSLFFDGSSNEVVLTGYADADHAGDLDTRRSTSGYVFLLGSCCVSWRSKQQPTVAKSSTEAEYIALSGASDECIWLRRLLTEIGFQQKLPLVLFEDNRGAIDLSKNPKFHDRTKHIDVHFHSCRERVQNGDISVLHCPSDQMVADIMTKALPRTVFERMRLMMGVVPEGSYTIPIEGKC